MTDFIKFDLAFNEEMVRKIESRMPKKDDRNMGGLVALAIISRFKGKIKNVSDVYCKFSDAGMQEISDPVSGQHHPMRVITVIFEGKFAEVVSAYHESVSNKTGLTWINDAIKDYIGEMDKERRNLLGSRPRFFKQRYDLN